MNLKDTLTTMTKIMHVFGCKGKPIHVFSGLRLLRKGQGYVCPDCNAEVEDITKSPIGREYFRWHRADLYPPLPRRKT